MARMMASTVSPVGEDVAGLVNLFDPRHFTDVDEAFDAGLALDDGAEVHEAGDGAGDALADDVAFGGGVPGLGLELLEAERDAAGFGVDFEDFEFELLAYGEDFFGCGDAGVRDVADVEEAVDAAEVDERAVGGERADGAADDVAFGEVGVAALREGEGLLFGDDAAVDDYVFVGDIELGDAAGDFGADELFHFGGFARAGAGGGHEGADADVDGEAALDYGGDGTDDGGFVGEGLFERGPSNT